MHPSSYKSLERFSKYLPPAPQTIADVGSFDVNGSYRPIFARPGWTYVGLDIRPGPGVDVVLSGEFEWRNIKDGQFDVVISGSTMEHTRMPWLFMKEVARIVKKGGLVCVNAPYQWEYHPHPIDCWRVFPDGMRAVMEWAGLTVLETFSMDNEAPHPVNKGDTTGIARK